ncbi:Extradiol ring-cleavage dioxygenase [Phytophthora cinnamomi]|uniref:Extradiol ring-cleavage dioxygenase n=1 Tax=Phytophthora cinnamomi TaxID=4785 RepID=UPI003559F2C0|nr:Extradiol ring-cleavage dioxygenase [Phytophthora cinnamomi]
MLYPNDKHLPKRILIVSAHFDAASSGFEISKSAKPDMIHDYYGLPTEFYDMAYQAHGDPEFARRVMEHLEQNNNNIKAKLVNRGFDHGVFVPMMLIRPQADIPVVTMSINSYLDSKTHFNLGKSLAAFREYDTLIICSGQSTHNARGVHDPTDRLIKGAEAFQEWLDNTLASGPKLSMDKRAELITNWQAAPAAGLSHPTPDHILPFVIAAGAGMEEGRPGAERVFGGWGMNILSFANYVWR